MLASTVGTDGLVEKAYTVTLQASPQTGGKLSGGGSFGTGENTTINATPATGYRFDGWYEGTDITGTAVSTDNSFVVNARTSDITYTAKFTQMNSLSIKTIGSGTVYCNGSSVSADYTENVAVGTKIVLKAIADEGYEFVYWMDKDNRVLSNVADSYTTYAGSETQIQAVFQAVSKTVDNKWNYRFINKNGNLITSSNIVEGSKVTVPVSNPVLIGYQFKGWKIKGTADTELINFEEYTIASNVVFEAVFEKDETKTYQVTVSGGTISGTETAQGDYAFDDKLTVIADAAPAGKVFSYWKNSNEEIVSYNESYSFSVGANVSLTAVFEEVAAEVLPTITGVISNKDTVNNRISFLFDRTMPEGCTMVQTGCIATDDATLGTSASDFVLGADEIDFTKVATSQNGTGQYMWTKGNASTTWYVRGYITYKGTDGVTVTVYTDILTGSLTE